MSFTLNLNLLDYSMGKPAPATTTVLAEQLTDQLKRKLAANGVPEAYLVASAAGVQTNIAGNPSFQSALVLAQKLATAVAANPWLKHIDTEAQGYSVVTATSSDLKCEFKKVNPLVGTTAPTTVIASTKTATITDGSTNITMS
jgi:alkaline phosphatase D